jgi:hypothetical protein
MEQKYEIMIPSGRVIDLLNPDMRLIDLTDIAYSLAGIIRYTGHMRRYTVAQHCVVATWYCSRNIDIQRALLLHDAAEALIGDISTPVKNRFPEIRVYENELLRKLAERFCINPDIFNDKEVKRVDRNMLANEVHYHFPNQLNHPIWQPYLRDARIFGDFPREIWSADLAEYKYLERARELGLN